MFGLFEKGGPRWADAVLKPVRWSTVSALVVVVCVFVGAAGVSQAGDGDLDDSFGLSGLGIVDPYKGGGLHGNVIAVQPDDKIIVAGSESDAGEPDSSIVLVRFNADGSLDTDFGDGGVSITDTPTMSDSVLGIAVHDNGEIVAVGRYTPDVQDATDNGFVTRFLPNGSPDKSFGLDGRVTLDLDPEETSLSAVIIESDGKIVVAGWGDAAGWIVARYETDGSLDTTFGNDGIIREPSVGDRYQGATALALQPDGKIVVAGRGIYSAAVARYDPDGSLDSTFGDDGIVTTIELQDPTLSYQWNPKSAVIQPDGKIAVGGWLIEETSAPLTFVLRFDADGSLDTGFPENGFYPGLLIVRPLAWDTAEYVADMLLQPDGKFVIAGQLVPYDDGALVSRDVFVRRIAATGANDPSFGEQGLVTLPLETYPSPGWLEVDQVSGVVMQSNGKLVVDCSCTGDVPGPGIVLFRLGTVAGLVPELTTPVSIAGGVTLRVSNYDPEYTWSVESNAGTAVIDGNGAISVTGLTSGRPAVITVSTSRHGYEAASTSTTGVALPAVLPETGATSPLIMLFATAFVALGGAMLATERRRDHLRWSRTDQVVAGQDDS